MYFAYESGGKGIFEIVDREKLLNGPKEPTEENLRYPVIGRVDLPPDMGAHTAFPLLQMELPEFAKQKYGKVKDFLAIVAESGPNECQEARQMLHIFDITTESKPIGVSSWTVPEASGNFCDRGGRFGTHSSNENFTPIYYKRVLFFAHFNAGVRAVDIRDPYQPEGDRVLHSGHHRQDRQALRRHGRRRALQDRDPDQQRRGGRPRLHLHRRPRQHRHAHPRTHRPGAPGGGFFSGRKSNQALRVANSRCQALEGLAPPGVSAAAFFPAMRP